MFQKQELFSYLLIFGLRSMCPESWEEYITLKSFLEFYTSAVSILWCEKLANSLQSKYCLYYCCFYLEVACNQVFRVLRCLDQQRILPNRKFHYFTRIFMLKCRNGCAKPTVFSTIYKSATTSCVTHVYTIYWRAQDGLDCEW